LKYPKIFRKINNAAGWISGGLVFVVALLAVFEIIMRGVFNRPTGWTMDVSTYLLLWTIFTGVAYSLQSKGQVAVDMVRSALSKHHKKLALKIIAILCHLAGVVVAGVFLMNGIEMTKTALKYDKLTTSAVQIPQVYLTISIVLGSALLLVTLVFIILDVLGGGEEYL